MSKIKVIRLYEETYNRLKQYGKMRESFDALVNRILDDYESMKSKSEPEPDEQKKISPEELFGNLLIKEEKEVWTEKYRPKTIDEMVGDSALLKLLKSYVNNKMSQTYFSMEKLAVEKQLQHYVW